MKIDFSKKGLIIIFLILFFSLILVQKVNNKFVSFVNHKSTAIPSPTLVLIDDNHEYKIPILVYHYVEYVKDTKDTIRQSLNISPLIFEDQIKTLINNGYEIILVKDAADILDGKKEFREKMVAITFDDGYKDFYTDVFPILKKYHVKATVYIISGFIGLPNFMDEGQLREISQSTLVELGSHTVNHVNLNYENEKVIISQLLESKAKLEEITGGEVSDFAYPFGGYNKLSKNLVFKCGYKSAVTTSMGNIQTVKNIYSMSRIRPGNKTGIFLLKWIEDGKY